MKTNTLYYLEEGLIFVYSIDNNQVSFSMARFLRDVFTSRVRYCLPKGVLIKLFSPQEINEENKHEFLTAHGNIGLRHINDSLMFLPYDIKPTHNELPNIFHHYTRNYEQWEISEYNLTYNDLQNGKFYTCEYSNQGRYTFKSGYDLWINHKSSFPVYNNGNFNPTNGFEKFRYATQKEINLLTQS